MAEHQYGPAALKVLQGGHDVPYELRKALIAAGFTEGRFHRGGGWSDEGAPEYEAPVHGFLLRKVYRPDGPGPGMSYRWAVDHIGPGRQEHVMRYGTVIADAGFPFEMAPLRPCQRTGQGRNRIVVVILTGWTHGGGR